MEDRVKDAEKIVSDMEKESELSKLEELIRDNKISFEHKDEKYRVRLLNLYEKNELDMLRRQMFGKLLQDKNILLEKDLIKQYKSRDVDIEEMDDKIKVYNAEELELQLKLGEAISKNEGEEILKGYKDRIEGLRTKKNILFTQKNLLLEFSLENQLLNYVAQIITYLSLEVLMDGVWERKFESLEEFQKYPDETLVNKAGQYSMVLQYI